MTLATLRPRTTFQLSPTVMTWFLIFAASVFALYFWRQYRARQRELDSPLASHRSGHSHIGQVIVLEQGLHNGNGRIRLGNRDWPVRGPNLPAGARARVTGVDGTILLVDRVAA
jgi:membrane protein implicated in regulation of membrane protease activity